MLTVGIDEVGRGCWAGPVVAGAVIMPADFDPQAIHAWRLADSKLLTKRQREAADAEIRQIALAVGLGWVDAPTIDRIGLTMAVRWAMEAALQQIKLSYDEIIIDGNYNFLAGNPKCKSVIKADNDVPAVSAASIVAKVARDRFMADKALVHPGYGFERHVGYGTVFHQEMLKLNGLTVLHRRSFKPVQALL